jgi:acetyltransferase-like isoleucine patch superfamily enzyme
MSIFRQTLVRHLARLWSVVSGPRILYGWQNHGGVYCAHTRISTHASVEYPAHLVLGDHVFIGHFNRIDATCGLEIDEGVQLTNFVSVLSHSSHRSVRIMGALYSNHPDPLAYVRCATRIGAYSFIGPHCVIAPGTRIGKGVIVQAHSFVSGDVPDFAIVGPQAMGQTATVVGDTRQIDSKLLHQYPQAQAAYAAWAGPDNLARALAYQPSPNKAPQ